MDRLYRRLGFASERERVERLLMLYEKMYAPLASKMQGKRRQQRKARLSSHSATAPQTKS
ncbi:hypothetical protein [Candidatus Synechococcus spongiarum]|uniref:hypothetical protein n=1 Tax=Candidatus Synechococcus spongiarum TaxID=431041 RepID=UPI003B84676B